MIDQTPHDLPPFSGEEPTCPKCGHTGASTRYRAARPRMLWDPWNDQSVMRGPLPERLQRECDRCQFCWDEALQPAHDAGPTVAEAAANDRRWWDGEKAGE